MSVAFYQISFLILTYLISSLPFGLILSKIYGKKDIRQHGSKNIGATNVARTLGKKLGLITLILDGLKGAAMVVIARYLFVSISDIAIFLVLVGGVAVIGHIFPIYIKFKGGKGVATTFAVLFAINPILGSVNCLAWVATFAITRISAVASLFAVTIATIFAIYYDAVLKEEAILCLFLSLLIFFRHQENIKRLIGKKENKF